MRAFVCECKKFIVVTADTNLLTPDFCYRNIIFGEFEFVGVFAYLMKRERANG
jgi:hypothetical protein